METDRSAYTHTLSPKHVNKGGHSQRWSHPNKEMEAISHIHTHAHAHIHTDTPLTERLENYTARKLHSHTHTEISQI